MQTALLTLKTPKAGTTPCRLAVHYEVQPLSYDNILLISTLKISIN